MALCDLHTHTYYSFDGHIRPFDLCAEARRHGLFGVAMSEHYDFYADDSHVYYQLFEDGRDPMLERLRSLYGSSLKIWKGIELGQPHYNLKRYRELMRRADFDFIIGSIHDLPPHENIYRAGAACRSQDDCDRIFESYFEEMTKMIEACDFDILAHLDYPVRVMGGAFREAPELQRYESLIRPILRLCAEKDIALEVNTAGLHKWQKRPGPGVWVLEAYKAYGGEKITLGSDAHRRIHVARGLDWAADMIREAGFDQITYFEQRKPAFVKI